MKSIVSAPSCCPRWGRLRPDLRHGRHHARRRQTSLASLLASTHSKRPRTKCEPITAHGRYGKYNRYRPNYARQRWCCVAADAGPSTGACACVHRFVHEHRTREDRRIIRHAPTLPRAIRCASCRLSLYSLLVLLLPPHTGSYCSVSRL